MSYIKCDYEDRIGSDNFFHHPFRCKNEATLFYVCDEFYFIRCQYHDVTFLDDSSHKFSSYDELKAFEVIYG